MIATIQLFGRATKHRPGAPALWLSLCVLLLGNLTLPAQEVLTLLSFTNVWAYDQSGHEPEPDWQSASYDDATWPRGQGLLGFEDNLANYLPHAPLQTRLVVSPAVTSFYFRTTFDFDGNLTGLSLLASNLIDDGCIIYLNGVEAARIRMPPSRINAATLASAGQPSEGTLETRVITNLSSLRAGRNVIAAEVHQNAPTSGDIMWGMKLMGIRAQPLTITREPQDLVLEEGQAGQIVAEIAGGPAFFQWYHNNAAILNATNAAMAFAAATPSQSGTYFVTVSNSLSAVRSRPVSLIVYEDHAGPRLLNAVTVISTFPTQTNLVEIFFSEPLLPGSGTTEITNYTLTRLAGGADISLVRAYMSVAGVRLLVDTTDPDWVLDAPCYVTVNHVRDLHSNVIAPNSRVSVGWTETYLVQPTDAVWDYHVAASFDPQVYDEPWMQPDYAEGPWWATGRGGFVSGLFNIPGCLGDTPTAIGFQPEPILFRCSFLWPTGLMEQAQIQFATRALDGMVLYLNATEIWRRNVGPGSIGRLSRALAPGNGCSTNTFLRVTNLVAGTNRLCVAVVASAVNPTDADVAFEFQMWASAARVPVEPPAAPAPTLQITRLDAEMVRLSWVGAGYALESATEPGTNTDSLFGPWQEVPEMSNPYHCSATNTLGRTRFFRLQLK